MADKLEALLASQRGAANIIMAPAVAYELRDEITRLNAEANEANQILQDANAIAVSWQRRAEKAEALVDEMREGLRIGLEHAIEAANEEGVPGVVLDNYLRDIAKLEALITKASRDSGHG